MSYSYQVYGKSMFDFRMGGMMFFFVKNEGSYNKIENWTLSIKYVRL